MVNWLKIGFLFFSNGLMFMLALKLVNLNLCQAPAVKSESVKANYRSNSLIYLYSHLLPLDKVNREVSIRGLLF